MKIMNSNGDAHVEVVAHIALAIVTIQVRGVWIVNYMELDTT